MIELDVRVVLPLAVADNDRDLILFNDPLRLTTTTNNRAFQCSKLPSHIFPIPTNQLAVLLTEC